MTMLKALSDFINSERNRFENRHNNMFAFSFAEISRYFEYLQVVYERYKSESTEFMDLTKAQQAMTEPGTHPVTNKMMILMEKSRHISTKLHMDIESFYLFAKILLDKIALAIEFYFGQGRNLSLVSHDKLVKNIERYSELKELTLSSELVKLAKKLKQDISDFRDYQITHIPQDKNARLTRGTMWDADGNTRLILNVVYPTEKDRQVETRLLQELSADIDQYVDIIVQFVYNNRSKTSLDLET